MVSQFLMPKTLIICSVYSLEKLDDNSAWRFSRDARLASIGGLGSAPRAALFGDPAQDDGRHQPARRQQRMDDWNADFVGHPVGGNFRGRHHAVVFFTAERAVAARKAADA